MSLGAMGRTFLRFPEERQREILDRCIDLFSRHGYENCSTNLLKKTLGVAKGTFYKYILSKEDLYLYLAEVVLQEMTEIQEDPAILASSDILHRFVLLNGKFLHYYIRSPRRCLFLMSITSNPSAPFYRRIEERRLELVREKLAPFLEGVDWKSYRYGKDEILRILSWVISGHRQDIYKRMLLGEPPDTLAAQAKEELDLILSILSRAFFY